MAFLIYKVSTGSDPSIILEFYSHKDGDEINQGQWYHTISDFKSRLDSPAVSYAFGMDPNDEKHILVKLAQSDYCGSTYSMLLGNAYDLVIDFGSEQFDLQVSLVLSHSQNRGFCRSGRQKKSSKCGFSILRSEDSFDSFILRFLKIYRISILLQQMLLFLYEKLLRQRNHTGQRPDFKLY